MYLVVLQLDVAHVPGKNELASDLVVKAPANVQHRENVGCMLSESQ